MSGSSASRERVELLGGTLDAGPCADGGWRLAAWLPWGQRVIRVLVIDDEALVRAGLRMILESADDISVVGEAEDGADAVEAIRRCRPDVVLMDIRMPRLDGLARHRGDPPASPPRRAS